MAIGIVRNQTINRLRRSRLYSKIHLSQRILHGSIFLPALTHERKSQHDQHFIPLCQQHRFKNILLHAPGYFRFNTLDFFSPIHLLHGFALHMNRNGVQNDDVRTAIYFQNPFIHVSKRFLHLKTTFHHNSGIQYFIFLVSQVLFQINHFSISTFPLSLNSISCLLFGTPHEKQSHQ